MAEGKDLGQVLVQFPKTLLAGKWRRDGLTLAIEFALVCPEPGAVWPDGHHNLDSKGEVWLKTSRSLATHSSAWKDATTQVLTGRGERISNPQRVTPAHHKHSDIPFRHLMVFQKFCYPVTRIGIKTLRT